LDVAVLRSAGAANAQMRPGKTASARHGDAIAGPGPVKPVLAEKPHCVRTGADPSNNEGRQSFEIEARPALDLKMLPPKRRKANTIEGGICLDVPRPLLGNRLRGVVGVRALVGPAGQRCAINGFIAFPATAGDILGIQPKNQASIDDRLPGLRQIGGNETRYQQRQKAGKNSVVVVRMFCSHR